MLGRLVVAILLVAPVAIAAEPVGPSMDWNILDCVFVFGTTPIPVARIADRVPAGFRPFGINTVTAGFVTQLGFEANICSEGSGAQGQVSPMLYASTWTPALAPPARNVPGFAMFVNWDVLVPDEERRSILVAAGTPAHDGSVAISADLRQGAPLTPFTVDYGFENGDQFHFDIMPRGPATPGGGRFAQYTPGANGKLTFWKTDWSQITSFSGVGTITLDPDSWQAKAFGTTVVPAQFNYGTWQYTNGKIVLPT